MKISKHHTVKASRTLESIQWGKTAVVSESVLQGIMSDIQEHLDTVYPENNLQCFVDLLKDYRGYQVFHVSTAPATTFDPVLQYRVYLHDTTVAHREGTAADESDIDVRHDYANIVCDIITKHVSTIPGRVTGSTDLSSTVTLTQDYFYDTVKNMEDNDWAEVLSLFRNNGWVQGNSLVIPSGTQLIKVSESRYYTVYTVVGDASGEDLPILKPEFGGEELPTRHNDGSSGAVISSEDMDDVDARFDDPNNVEGAVQCIKDAAQAHNYIGDIDAEIGELGSSPESLYQIYHDIIDVGLEVQSRGLGNWRFLLPSETEYDEPVISTDVGYYVVCARGSIQLVHIDEDELF